MTQRILIVDDDPLIREMAAATFASAGYFIEGVEDGEKALVALRKQRPDLVLLDATMPGLDGFQTLARMKADTALRDIPVIMLTALRAERDVRRALALGISGYLVKPLVPAALLERVKRLGSLKPTRETAIHPTEVVWEV